MAASSESLAQSGKRSTRSTVKLTPGEALQVLQSAAAMCQDSGLSVQRATMHEQGVMMAAIVITGAQWVDGELVIASSGTGAP